MNKNIILLIVRILVGGMIAFAGYKKLMDIEQGVSSINAMIGLSLSTITIWLAVLIEFVLGLGIIFGLWTRLAAFGSFVAMAMVIYFTKGENITTVLLLIGSLILSLVGGGKWVLIGIKKKHLMPNLPVAAKF